MRIDSSRSRTFTLIEMLIVIAIIMIIVSLLQPALKRAMVQARVVVCMTNLKNHGTALIAYTADYNGWLPPGSGHPNGDTIGTYPDSLNYYDQFLTLTDDYGLGYDVFECPTYTYASDTSWFFEKGKHTAGDIHNVGADEYVGGYIVVAQHAARKTNPGGFNLYTHYLHLYNQSGGGADLMPQSPGKESDGPDMILAADRTGRYNRGGWFNEYGHSLSDGFTSHAVEDGLIMPAGGSRVYLDGSTKWVTPDEMGEDDKPVVFYEDASVPWGGDPRYSTGGTFLTW